MNKTLAGLLSFSAAGIILLASQENFSAKPYLDSNGKVTNGFGNATIEPNKTVTVVKALEDLKVNTSSAGQAVSKCIVAPITQNQYDAYVSFTYNVGASAFCKSAMAKKANAGDLTGSCNEFNRWMYVGGKDCRVRANNCAGIVKRREAERALCLTE